MRTKSSSPILIRWAQSPPWRSIPPIPKCFYVPQLARKKDRVFSYRGTAGKTWKKQVDVPGRPRRIWVDPHSPPIRARYTWLTCADVIVADGSAVRKVSAPASGQRHFLRLRFSIAAHHLRDLGRRRLRFYRWRSEPCNKRALPGTGAKVRAIATSFHHPEIAYVSYDHLVARGKRVDRRRQDHQLWRGLATGLEGLADVDNPASNMHDAWITERFGPGWGENPAGHDRCGSGSENGVRHRSRPNHADRLTAAQPGMRCTPARVDNAGWTTTGLDVTNSYGIHFDPFDSKRVFITYTDIGLFRSEDGGVSWTSSTAGVPRDWREHHVLDRVRSES